MTAEVATKLNPEKWETAKQDAVARMGGRHSARAMQLASKLYKDRGGRYAGRRPGASENSLRTWTKQDWKWSGGDTHGEGGKGVYLPRRAVSALKSTEGGKAKLERASQIKREATARGQQFSSHGLHVGKDRSHADAQKTAGWRHLPAILGGVRDNLVNHTLPGIRASRAVQQAVANNPDINYAHELPKEVLPAAGRHFGVDPRLLGARARLGRMAEKQGLDPHDVLEDVERGREGHLFDQHFPDEPGYDHAAFTRADKRLARSREAARDLFIPANHNFISGKVTPSLRRLAAEGDAPQLMPEFYRQIGAEPANDFAKPPMWLGSAHEQEFANNQMITARGVPMRVGVNSTPYAIPKLNRLSAASPTSFLHEAGHMTGFGRHLPLGNLLEETRAWMGAEDVRKDLINKGAPADLFPPDVRNMTPEQRSQHLAGLGTYFDAAARSVAKPMYNMFDRVRQYPLVQQFSQRLRDKKGT